MNIKFDRAELFLEAHQVLRLRNASGTQVQCLQGALWVTQYRDHQDHFVGPGNVLTLDRAGLALIHAIAPTELVLSEPAPPPSGWQRAGRLLASALRTTGRWIAQRFGPEAISDRRWRGWYGAL